jgi:voltage-gated potassium channel Kch
MEKITLAHRLRYRFDNLMSRGPIAMISLLAFFSLLVIVISGAILWFFHIAPEGGEPMNFVEDVWQSLLRALDSGTMGGDVGWPFRAVTFFVTMGGIFILSTLIGVLGTGIESKLEDLKKGKSFVMENNHTLILGWSSKIFTLISELVIANENQKKPRIVILADKDKVEMEDEIRNKIGNLKNTKVICRKGSPNDLVDLGIANPYASKSIIILAAEEGNADPLTIKTILAITNNPNRRTAPYHIVAEIRDKKNVEIAKMVGKDEIETILTDEIIGRMMVQTSRQSGLSIVFTELLDFDGAEIYMSDATPLAGKTYGDVISRYENSAVMGLQFAGGVVKINPPMDYVVRNGDKVIAITEDDDTLVIAQTEPPAPHESAIVNVHSGKVDAERILLLGWNKRALTIIREMDNYVGKGSYMKVVSTFDTDAEVILAVAESLVNIRLEFQHADTTTHALIDSLDITSYDSIQLLCYKDEMDMQDADAQTLISLLHIRRVMDETGKDIKIVSEMLDLKNRDLAEVTKADDFIVSDKLISLLMSQISENKYLMGVFEDLFSATGSEIYLNPAGDYIKTGENIDFYTVLESARRKGHTAIGYRKAALAHDHTRAYGVVINPVKSNGLTFEAEDKVIVLAEE